VRFVGNTVIATQELEALADRLAGRSASREELREIALRVTELYVGRGFVLARATPRSDRAADGVPEIEIAEGRLGSLKVLDLPVRDAQAVQEVFAPVMAKGVFERSAASAAVKTLIEQHGLAIRLHIERGSAPGTVNLMIARSTSGTPEIQTPGAGRAQIPPPKGRP
jgi:hemolysin activation/secretion protein